MREVSCKHDAFDCATECAKPPPAPDTAAADRRKALGLDAKPATDAGTNEAATADAGAEEWEEEEEEEEELPVVVQPFEEVSVPTVSDALKSLLEGVSAADYVKPEAKAAREELESTKQEEEKLGTEVKELEEETTADYGPEGVFWSLKGETFEGKFGEFTYKLSPFEKAEQDYTSLGNWEGYERQAEKDGGKWVFKFTNGQHCWNGPARSATAVLSCGVKNELVDVRETETCVYGTRPPPQPPATTLTSLRSADGSGARAAMKFKTPAACEESAGSGKDEL